MARIVSSLLLVSTCFAVLGCVPPDDAFDSNTTFEPQPAAAPVKKPQPPRLQSNTTSPPAIPEDAGDVVEPADDDEGADEKPKKDVGATATKAPKTKVAANAKPIKASFDALVVGMQEDIAYRPFMMTPESRALHDKVIQIPGYMFGGTDKLEGLTEIILLRAKECKFGPGGQADHLIKVKLKKGHKTDISEGVVYVQGTLEFKPWQGPDGNTWSIYEINDGQVVRGSRF